VSFLLDTHTFLWFVWGDPRISLTARRLIEDVKNVKFISLVTPWEIAIKSAIGKFKLGIPVEAFIQREITQGGILLLPIKLSHVTRVATLPLHHRDPFDRLLIAQAIVENVPILSADPAFDVYPVTRLW
jgi:PIN domain nuclease of toxin-antitoxin system